MGWVGFLGLAVVIWAHLLRTLMRWSLRDRFEEAADMAARPPAEWTDDDRDSGLGLPATQLRLAERAVAAQLPIAVVSVVLVALGLALG